jgi:FkbM family methyltransferase
MRVLKSASKPIAKTIAQLVNSRLVSMETFRNMDFKGKQTISDYLDPNLFPDPDIYQCQDILFDIDFQDQIQKYIYLNLYEKVDIKIIEKYVKPGACCFDVGANIGYYSLHMAKTVGSSGRVFAFEPDPVNIARLDRNIALNHQTDVIKTYQLGLSSETATKRFSRTLDSNSGWGRIGECDDLPDKLEIQTTSLDDFVSAHQIEKIDFLKCDIEGHEFEFLKGAEQTLKAGAIDYILIEYCGYVLEKQGRFVQDYVDIFQSYGYQPILLNLDRLKEHIPLHTYNLLFSRVG